MAAVQRVDLSSVRKVGVEFLVARLFPSAEPLAEPITNERLRNAVHLTADILAAKSMNMNGPRPAALIRKRNTLLSTLSNSDLEEFARDAFLLLAANKISRSGRINMMLGTVKDVAAQLGISWDDRGTMDALEGALDSQLITGALEKDRRDHYVMKIGGRG